MFSHLSREKLGKVVAFATTPDSSAEEKRQAAGADWRRTIAAGVDAFVELHGLSVQEQARVVRDEWGVDVLVDMDGWSNQGLRAEGLLAL